MFFVIPIFDAAEYVTMYGEQHNMYTLQYWMRHVAVLLFSIFWYTGERISLLFSHWSTQLKFIKCTNNQEFGNGRGERVG